MPLEKLETNDNQSDQLSVNADNTGNGVNSSGFTDNRPEAEAQKEMQAMLKKSPQTIEGLNYQQMANNGSKTGITEQMDALGPQAKKQNMSEAQSSGVNTQEPQELSEQDSLDLQSLTAATNLLKTEGKTVSLELQNGHKLDDVERLIKIGVGVGFVKVGVAIGGIVADAASLGTLGKVFTISGKAVGIGKDLLDAHIKDKIQTANVISNKEQYVKDSVNSEIKDMGNAQIEGIKEQAVSSVFDFGAVKDKIKEEGTQFIGQESIDTLVPIIYSLKELILGVKETYTTYKEQKEALGEAAIANIQTSVSSLTNLYAKIGDVKKNLQGPFFASILKKVESLENNMKTALDELILLATKFQKMRLKTKIEEVDWDDFETRPRSEKDVSEIRDEAVAKKRSPIKEKIGDSPMKPGNIAGFKL